MIPSSIQEIYGIKPVTPSPQITSLTEFLAAMGRIAPKLEKELQSIPKKILIRSLNTLAGIEIETEGHEGTDTSYPKTYFTPVIDGSLRNNGMEHVSNLGLRAHHLFTGLLGLIPFLKTGGCTTSDRTSIHVHVNVLNLSMEELNSFIILYALVEDSLFEYAGKFREDNIFCTPLASTLKGNCEVLETFISRANKYAAFNTKAVAEKGTVEFRHMHTSYDIEYVYRWVVMLCLLRYYARYHSLEEIKETVMTLRNRSEYTVFFRSIFYDLAEHLPIDPMKVDSLATDAKLFFFGDK